MKIHMTKAAESGITLGGLGTGTVELWPDGEFHLWQIANVERWAARADLDIVNDGEKDTGALSFWVRTKKRDGRVLVRKLGMKTDQSDFSYRMFGFNRPVESIDFEGTFPTAALSYHDPALPIRLSLKATSPFVAHRTDFSSTPGFYLDFTVNNPTDEPITVSLMGSLIPTFAEGPFENTLLENSRIVLRPARISKAAGNGSLCFAVSGDGTNSYLTADYYRFLKEYISHSEYGITQESFLFDFREKGILPNTTVGSAPSGNCLEELMAYPFAQSLWKRIKAVNPSYPVGEEENFLACCRKQMEDIGPDFGACALCKELILNPGETANVRFMLSWYFPNHYSSFDGHPIGHYYENRFADADEVMCYLQSHADEIVPKAEALSKLLFTTSLPEVYAESWSSHLSTLIKSSWWLKDGRFGLWEGLGFCGFHTTDITYHAAFPLISLFPELQLKQMQMGLPFQRKDGRVHHFFTPDMEHVDDGFDRIDMNNQFVLMVLRDYLFTGDLSYLECMWEPVCRAMDSIEALDSDGDALPDQDTRRNTYDAWNFDGIPTYIAILWLAALKAGVQLAKFKNDAVRAAHWESLRIRGLTSLEEKLWNGQYYDLWSDGTRRDASIMTDQLDGEWFLRMMGLSGNLSDERVNQVLRFIFAHNFDPDEGLVNAGWLSGEPTTIFTYHNCQADACWSGINYVAAAMAMRVGLTGMADAVITAIHENHVRLGKFWDHWECGLRYTRPLSSFTTMLAASGICINEIEKTISFSPIAENLTVPFFTKDAYGLLSFRDGQVHIQTVDGSLDGYTILYHGI